MAVVLQAPLKAIRRWYVGDKRKGDEGEDDFLKHRERSRLFQHVNQMHIQASVRKLYHHHEFLGSFIYLTEEIGACAFHCVLDGKEILQKTLSVDHAKLQHLISYPFYDLSFYYVPDKPEHVRVLSLAGTDCILPGDEVILASHAPYDGNNNDIIDLSYGLVSRLLLSDSPLIAASYNAFHGSSGGAVLSLNGELLGIHMESMYCEKTYRGFTMQEQRKWRPAADDITVKYPSFYWSNGSRLKEEQKLAQNVPDVVAGFAAANVCSKENVAGFLPMYHIRHRLNTAKYILATNLKAVS